MPELVRRETVGLKLEQQREYKLAEDRKILVTKHGYTPVYVCVGERKKERERKRERERERERERDITSSYSSVVSDGCPCSAAVRPRRPSAPMWLDDRLDSQRCGMHIIMHEQ